MRRFLLALCAFVAMTGAAAQDYPSKAVKIVVPFAPGAGNDTLGRLTAEYLTPRLGQPVVVENKAGAGSQIGIDFVAKSPPDGYTLVWAASDGITILPAVKPNMPYRVPEDFTFIARIVQIPFVIAVNPDLPIKNVADLIAYAKANPGKVKYGTSGIGGGPHMGSALIEKAAGVEMLHIPYSGVAPALNALLGKSIDIALITPPTVKPHTDAGAFRAIATTGTERHPLFPDLPTLQESGLPNYGVASWNALAAPAGTPKDVIAKLNAVVNEAAKSPDLQSKTQALGVRAQGSTPEQLDQLLKSEIRRWGEVIANAKITPQ